MQRAAELQLSMPGAMRLVLLDNDITGIELAWSACGTEDVGRCQMRLLTRGVSRGRPRTQPHHQSL
jgi:hypothetical protein